MIKQLLDRMWAGGTADSEVYALVAAEIASQQMDVGLWAKACAATDGDLQRAKARYIELRVSDLKAARRALESDGRRHQKQLQREAERHAKFEQLDARAAFVQQQIWELHDSPEAKRRMKSRRRVSGTVLSLLALPGLALSWVLTRDVVGTVFLFGFGVVGLLLLWALINSSPSPKRRDLLQELARIENQRART